MIQIVTTAAATSKRKYITYKFHTMEAARLFIERFNLENKIVDILN